MKVVVTLTTIPSRISDIKYEDMGIKSCIESLSNQSYNDYEIHFNIPYTCLHLNKKYIIPDWLNNYPKIKVFRVDDLGPVTKTVPTVQRITDPETIIIVCDDDLVYHPDMIQAQVDNQLKWKEEIVGYDGLRSRNDDGSFALRFRDSRDHYFTSHQFVSKVDILQHYKTVSYKRRYFEDDFFDFVEKYHSWSDDLLLAAYFSFKKRNRIVETHPLIPKIDTFDEWLAKGGVQTFPVISHTQHDSYEGCNIFRQTYVNDNGDNLYKFIDKGYE